MTKVEETIIEALAILVVESGYRAYPCKETVPARTKWFEALDRLMDAQPPVDPDYMVVRRTQLTAALQSAYVAGGAWSDESALAAAKSMVERLTHTYTIGDDGSGADPIEVTVRRG